MTDTKAAVSAEAPTEKVRLNLNLPADIAQQLREIAARRQLSLTDVVSHALALESYVDSTVAKGGKILVEDSNNNLRELLILGR